MSSESQRPDVRRRWGVQMLRRDLCGRFVRDLVQIDHTDPVVGWGVQESNLPRRVARRDAQGRFVPLTCGNTRMAFRWVSARDTRCRTVCCQGVATARPEVLQRHPTPWCSAWYLGCEKRCRHGCLPGTSSRPRGPPLRHHDAGPGARRLPTRDAHPAAGRLHRRGDRNPRHSPVGRGRTRGRLHRARSRGRPSRRVPGRTLRR